MHQALLQNLNSQIWQSLSCLADVPVQRRATAPRSCYFQLTKSHLKQVYCFRNRPQCITSESFVHSSSPFSPYLHSSKQLPHPHKWIILMLFAYSLFNSTSKTLLYFPFCLPAHLNLSYGQSKSKLEVEQSMQN